MEITHILEELAYDMGELPREAIEAAVAKREQITPHLIKILEEADERIDEIIENDNYQGHLFAMYLLAQFREEAAYPLLIKLISFPGEIPHIIMGDVLTEDFGRILASVCGKEIEPILKIIENFRLNEYVRAAAETSLVTLVSCGQIPRLEVVDYFKSLLTQKLERTPSYVWDHLIACCCELYPEELLIDIERAFEKGLVDSSFIQMEDVKSILSNNKKEEHLYILSQNSELIEDTVTEMEKWISSYRL